MEKHLTIVARILAKEGQSERLHEALVKLIDPTRAEEGCIDYILHRDNSNSNMFLFYENWATRELWQQHMETEHIKDYLVIAEETVEEFIVNEMTIVK